MTVSCRWCPPQTVTGRTRCRQRLRWLRSHLLQRPHGQSFRRERSNGHMFSHRAVLRLSSVALTATIAGCSGPSLGDGSESGANEAAGVVWNRRYEGDRATRFLDIVPASTGGFLLVGTTTSDADVLGQGFAIRTDDEGSEQWRYTVSGPSALLTATQGADGEFVAVTYRAGAGGTGDSGAVALTDDGTER